MNIIVEKLKEGIAKLNEYGIPLPMIRINGQPTFTGTMTFISFNTALLGQAGKIAGFFGGIDLSQANYLFLICLGAYLGRRMQTNSTNKTVDLGDKEEK